MTPVNLSALASRLHGLHLRRFATPRWILVLAAIGIVCVATAMAFLAGGRTPVAPEDAISQPQTTAGAVTTTASAVSAAPAATKPATPGNDDDSPAETVRPGPADELERAREAAIAFVADWLNTSNKSPEQWREDFRGKVTPELYEQYEDVDPTEIVPNGVIGTGTLAVWRSDQLVEARIPIVTARTNNRVQTVVVEVTHASGKWLASSIDRAEATS